jgi:3-hydroxybutyrate dehydrogenase
MLKGKTALVHWLHQRHRPRHRQGPGPPGANIVLNGFGDAEGPKAEVAALGVKVGYHDADMGKAAQIEAMMKYAADNFGRVDILVNNAGIQHVAKVEDFPPERWDAIIAINLTSAFHTTRLRLPAMKKANWGRIINVASVHGLVARPRSPPTSLPSTASSAHQGHGAGDGHHRHHLQRDLPRLGADAAGAEAGGCARRRRPGISNEEAKKQLLAEKEPSLQFTTPEELGELAVFFCSDAGKNVRGVAWNMDGRLDGAVNRHPAQAGPGRPGCPACAE